MKRCILTSLMSGNNHYTGTSGCSHLAPVVLKSEACHDVLAESQSVDDSEQATIEAASIEFTPAIKEDVRSRLSSSVTLEAEGKHGLTKVSIATA